ncbi:MAG: hypothetical protein GXP31_02110 [Kiritimatiellaeota bacterium]|nr:hypothetical protein [Kiritimatiellota bacterium]
MKTTCLGLVFCATLAAAAAEKSETVGKRPYEMIWAHRDKDDNPPLVDFENLDGWTVETRNAVARFERSREQQIWGKFVGKLTYRAAGSKRPFVRVLPPAPIPIRGSFDAVSCWIYGNNWAWVRDATTPRVSVSLDFADPTGAEFAIRLGVVRWKEWFLCHRRLTPEQIARVANGAEFRGITIGNGLNKQDRVLYFDNLAVFIEKFPPLSFEPRPKRGIDMFPGQSPGTNTGPGRLPFPTRPETILPDNLARDSRTTAVRDKDGGVRFEYEGSDGRLTWLITPRTGTFDDIRVRWHGRGGWIRPCVGGGVFPADANGKPVAPDKAELVDAKLDSGVFRCRWKLTAPSGTVNVTWTLRVLGKSLVLDLAAPGGNVCEVRYGRAVGFAAPRAVPIPYLTYGRPRPGLIVAGRPESPLFFSEWTDWYRSNASVPWGGCAVTKEGAVCNGGVRYIPLTNGRRNDCFERLIFTLAPRVEEVLPNIPNPQSPWKKVTGTRVWRAHGASNRENDAAFWRKVHRYGMTQVIVTDHETGWRDGGESFTFRTRPAPGKGGDAGQYKYARIMQDELGFVYGPYNNFTDFAPVNEFWSYDMISRTPDNQLQGAWARCYAPKPARAVEYCARLAPIIQKKFHFSTAYCDVHTAVAPWSRVDYDPRVPGAGTFAAVFYAYGEIMLLQKKAWNGPVYSEGGHHFPYCGLTDGNYGQDQSYRLPENPWLVDFDLRKMHPLCCNFGMGNPGMFYGRNHAMGTKRREIDAYIDRFLAATVAFGHPGFLAFEGGYRNALRSYFMLQQLHSRYTLADAADIRYADAGGQLLDSSAALARGAYRRSQIVTRYTDGTVTVVNGHPAERLKVRIDERPLDLPPNGYAGWTRDGAVEVFSGDRDGTRCDYVVSPAYLYVDGRGRFVRFPKAAGAAVGICRILPDRTWEVILYDGLECGFAVDAATAVALNEAGEELGPAELRRARGLTFVMPVKEAFSYRLRGGSTATGPDLRSDRDTASPGETVVVRGREQHRFQIPRDARAGDRIWRKFEGKWIDFTVIDPARVDLRVDGDKLRADITSQMAVPAKFVLVLNAQHRTLELTPGAGGRAEFALPPARDESIDPIALKITAGAVGMTVDRLLLTESGFVELAPLPAHWTGGIRLRGKPEQVGFGETRGHAYIGRASCNNQDKKALDMHPPYRGGVGYTYALFDAIRLPAAPPARFRAMVGKRDGSDLGDGILYRVEVVDPAGNVRSIAEETVTKHQWRPIAADLGPWAGKTLQLKLIADVGRADNSSGDWACWADMRIESARQQLIRKLIPPDGAFATAPPPVKSGQVPRARLRAARSGRIHYDGIGLEGAGNQYETTAVLNGVVLGPMARAGGSEVGGKWAEDVTVALTPAAIRTLKRRNRFQIRNPGRDCFKVRRFWIELELADGRKCASRVSTAVFTQPGTWRYAEGIGVPADETLTISIWFE